MKKLIYIIISNIEILDLTCGKIKAIRQKIKNKFDIIGNDAVLNRAIETCRIIAEPHKGKIVTTPLLRERDWGAFTGRFIPDLKGEPFPDDVESLDKLLQRAQHFIDFIRERFPDQTVLAVGHGIINKAIQAQFFHKQMREVERMGNAEVRTLDIP